MLIEELFSFPFSLIIILAIGLALFGVKVQFFNKKIYENLYKLPSVIVVGPRTTGKTTLVKELTGSNHFTNAGKGDVTYSSYINDNKKLQFIDPHFPVEKLNSNNIEELKRLNYKMLIYLFDVTPGSELINTQIDRFRQVTGMLGNVKTIPVVNKFEKEDQKKMKTLSRKLKKIIKISLANKSGMEKLKSTVFYQPI